MPRINIADTRPATRQIAEHYAAHIRAGDLATGQQLPATSQLCADWGVSSDTVRGAIDLLRSAGLVLSRRGVGVFVTGAEPVTYQLTDAEPEAGEAFVPTVPTSEAAEALGLDLADPVHTSTVLAYAGTGRVVARTVTTYPGMPTEEHTPVRHSTYRLHARVPTPDELQDMQLPAATPVLVRERIDYGPDRVAAYSVTVYYGPVTRLEHRD